MYFDDQPGTHGVAAVVLLRKRGAWRFDYAAYITMHGIESDMMVQDRNASGQRGWRRGCVCTLCVSDGLGSLSSLYGYVLSGVTHCRERFRVTQQKLGKEILKRVFPLLLCTVVLRSLFPVYTQGSLTHVHTGIVQGLFRDCWTQRCWSYSMHRVVLLVAGCRLMVHYKNICSFDTWTITKFSTKTLNPVEEEKIVIKLEIN